MVKKPGACMETEFAWTEPPRMAWSTMTTDGKLFVVVMVAGVGAAPEVDGSVVGAGVAVAAALSVVAV
jgi:hypothetical protein